MRQQLSRHAAGIAGSTATRAGGIRSAARTRATRNSGPAAEIGRANRTGTANGTGRGSRVLGMAA
jgi:hypothetical protein